jgi:hypothetical protein
MGVDLLMHGIRMEGRTKSGKASLVIFSKTRQLFEMEVCKVSSNLSLILSNQSDLFRLEG